FLKLFGHLGYRPVAVVRKRRRIYEWTRDGFTIHASLDDVESVGRFIEIEIVADESKYEAARAIVFGVAAELQLGATATRSYPDPEQCLGRAVPPGRVR